MSTEVASGKGIETLPHLVHHIRKPSSLRWPALIRHHSSPQSVGSSSPGRQVLSNHASNGPYSRSMMNHDLPGTVCTQLVS